VCGSWDVYAAILGEEKESNYDVHKQHAEVERLPSGDRVGFLEDKNHSGAPSWGGGVPIF